MASGNYEWLTLEQAAVRFGYGQLESLRRRLRHLRERGDIVDLGNPPPDYKVAKETAKDKIVLYWPNPQIALMRSDAPANLLIPRRGKRARNLGT